MLSAYPIVLAEIQNERYTLRHGDDLLVFYTNRSGARDLSLFNEKIAATPSGHTCLIVAPYSATFAPLFKEPRDLIFIAPESFSVPQPRDARLITDDTALEHFVNAMTRDDKFDIFIPPQWGTLHDAVRDATRHILARAAVRLKTIRHFTRLWPINFRLNAPRATDYADIMALGAFVAPDALVMAGPSLDRAVAEIKNSQSTWCADTAFPALVRQGIYPQVVFSIDAGFASQEHFDGLRDTIRRNSTRLVCDLLGNPQVQRLPFKEIFVYASSHPLVQNFVMRHRPQLTPLENASGDVGQLMLSALRQIFPTVKPKIFGHDGGHRNYVTHARGTAYFARASQKTTRIYNTETYFYRLSARYGAARCVKDG